MIMGLSFLVLHDIRYRCLLRRIFTTGFCPDTYVGQSATVVLRISDARGRQS